MLYGNVADRFPLKGRLVSLTAYLDTQLLSGFALVFLYDPGNGLSVLRTSDGFQQWPGATAIGAATREPRAAVELITRYLRFRANLSAMGRGEVEPIACIVRGADQILPANRQGDFEKTIGALQERTAKEPDNPEAHHMVATFYWDKVYRDFRLPADEKMKYVQAGITEVDKAIQLKNDYVEAITYKNLLLRLQANLEKEPAKQQALLREADRLRDQALELRKKSAGGA